MAQITIREINKKVEWEDFLKFHPESNFLQSWNWGEFHKSLKRYIFRTGFYKNNKLIGLMLSVIEPAKRARYLIVPGGPIIDWNDKEIITGFVEQIKTIAKNSKCVFVRVRPQLISNDFSKKLFKTYGFINAPIHLHAELTSQLDLTKSEDEILSNMRKTTRYEIRKATSLGIKILTSDDLSNIEDFYKLQISTAKRQGFVPFSYSYLFEQFKVFSENNEALLYSSKFENKLLAQAMIIFYGKEAVYHYGASTQEGRSYPGAYLIQWETIKEAKTRGMKRYNFWGVAPEDKKDHRFYGVSVFKRGFGGQDVEYLHAQDLVIDQPRYIINWLVEETRKKIRRI